MKIWLLMPPLLRSLAMKVRKHWCLYPLIVNQIHLLLSHSYNCLFYLLHFWSQSLGKPNLCKNLISKCANINLAKNWKIQLHSNASIALHNAYVPKKCYIYSKLSSFHIWNPINLQFYFSWVFPIPCLLSSALTYEKHSLMNPIIQ